MTPAATAFNPRKGAQTKVTGATDKVTGFEFLDMRRSPATENLVVGS